jgi:excisionase family DNA binding protein
MWETIMSGGKALKRIGYRPREAAQICGVSHMVIYAALRNGSLKSSKIGKVRLITEASLLAWIEQHSAPALRVSA